MLLRKPSEIIIDGKTLKEILNKHEKSLILVNADLRSANLRGVDLKNADLTNADLRGASLKGANLIGAILRNAELNSADLSYADLSNTDLSNANLSYANLISTDLSNADLRNAILNGTILRGAYLSNSILDGVKYDHKTAFFAVQCPEEGSFIGYKKAGNKIIKLLILEDSKRNSATSRKCRCDKAKVLSIESLDSKEKFTEAKSDYNSDFIYKVGEIVKVDNFCEDRWKECAPGIHFFITKEEAINY